MCSCYDHLAYSISVFACKFHISRSFLRFRNSVPVTIVVKMFTTFSFVSILFSNISFARTLSLIVCMLISMYFVLWCDIGFFVIVVVEVLFVKITSVIVLIFTSLSKFVNHVTSHDVYVSARYSTSVDDRATVYCFLVCHDIMFPCRYMANPMVDLRVIGQEAQSESENASIPKVIDPEKNKSELGECLIYLNILLTIFASVSFGFFLCWLKQLTTCAMFGLVTVR